MWIFSFLDIKYFFKLFSWPLTNVWFFVALQLLNSPMLVLKPRHCITEIVPKPSPSFLKCYMLAQLVLQSTFNMDPAFTRASVGVSHAGHILQEPQGKLFLPFHLSPALKYSIVIHAPPFINLPFFVSHFLLLGVFFPFRGPSANLSSFFRLPAS